MELSLVINPTKMSALIILFQIPNAAAVEGVDYTLADGRATITAGNTAGTLTLVIDDDNLDEVNETVVVELSNPANGSIGSVNTMTITIVDEDPEPTVRFAVGADDALLIILKLKSLFLLL